MIDPCRVGYVGGFRSVRVRHEETLHPCARRRTLQSSGMLAIVAWVLAKDHGPSLLQGKLRVQPC